MNSSASHASRTGLLCGLAAYGLWGLIPLYFKAVAYISRLEVLAHRGLWSCVILIPLVAWAGQWPEVRRVLRSRRLVGLLSASALLIGANWLTFIYSVASGQVLQASLGYFANPLVSVLLGVVFLHERLRPYQLISIGLAGIGVFVLAAMVGSVPWVALTLAFTFAFYGLLRKIMPVDGMVSLSIETGLMTPFCLAYLGWLAADGRITGGDLPSLALLMLAGPVTTVPLLFFGAAAPRLRLSTLGILQYITPTGQFLLAVLAFDEPFSTPQLVSFACIWIALAIYSAGAYRQYVGLRMSDGPA